MTKKQQAATTYDQIVSKIKARYRKAATLDEAFAWLDARLGANATKPKVKVSATKASLKQATALGEQYGKFGREMNNKARALSGDTSANMKAFAAAFIDTLIEPVPVATQRWVMTTAGQPPKKTTKKTTKKKASK